MSSQGIYFLIHTGEHIDPGLIHLPGLLIMPGTVLRILVKDPQGPFRIRVLFHQDRPQDLRVLAFVSQRPHNDARMVPVPADHVVFPVDDRGT